MTSVSFKFNNIHDGIFFIETTNDCYICFNVSGYKHVVKYVYHVTCSYSGVKYNQPFLLQSEILILLKDLAKRRKQRRKFFCVCKDSLKEAVRDSLLGFLGLAIFRYIIEERSTNGKQLLSRKTQNITSVAISL